MKLKVRTIPFTAFGIAIALAVAACGRSGPSSALSGKSPQTRSSLGHTSPSGSSSAGNGASGAVAESIAATQAGQRQEVNLEIRTTEKMDGEEQPRYVPAGASPASLKHWTGNITVKRGETVTLTIVNHDEGPGSLAPSYRQFDAVQDGSETVDGAAVTRVPNSEIAHTFTIFGVGKNGVVNGAIPDAPKGGTDKIVLTFKATRTGKFPWRCFAPCGMGPEGFAAAMDKPGWMAGTITVVS